MTPSPWPALVAAVLAPLRRTEHYVCDEDCWYTCPAATDEHDGGSTCDGSKRGQPCQCEIAEHNAEVDAIAARIARKIEAALHQLEVTCPCEACDRQREDGHAAAAKAFKATT